MAAYAIEIIIAVISMLGTASGMRSGNRPVTSRSRPGSCSSCWVRSTTSTGTFCSTTRWPSARSTRRAPSSNARSRAASRRRGSPNACRSAIRGSARCSGSMPEPRLRNISRRSGSCVPKSCSIRRSSPSRRSHTGSGSRPRATFPHSSAKGRASRPSSTAASGGSPGGNLLSRRPSPGFRAARRICGSLRRHVPHRWRSGAKAPPCSSGR